MKYVLYVDSSILGISLGIASQAQPSSLLWSQSKAEREVSASVISALFHEGMKSLSIDQQAIGHVVVSNGPGSFTGIRIGLAWAYGLYSALRNHLKLVGVSSLETLAMHYYRDLESPKDFGVFLPATRSQGFFSLVTQQGVKKSISMDCRKMTDQHADQLRKSTLLFVEPGSWWVEFLKENQLEYESVSLADFARTSLESMAYWVEKKSLLDQKGDETLPQPNYIRFSSAEEKLHESRRKPNC